MKRILVWYEWNASDTHTIASCLDTGEAVSRIGAELEEILEYLASQMDDRKLLFQSLGKDDYLVAPEAPQMSQAFEIAEKISWNSRFSVADMRGRFYTYIISSGHP